MTTQLQAPDIRNKIAQLDALRSSAKPSSRHVLSKVDRLAVRHLAAFSAMDWTRQETWLALNLVRKYSAKLGLGEPDKNSAAALDVPANSAPQVTVTQSKPTTLDGDSLLPSTCSFLNPHIPSNYRNQHRLVERSTSRCWFFTPVNVRHFDAAIQFRISIISSEAAK